MEPQGSLLRSQEPVTCPYPEPGQSSPCPLLSFMPGLSKWSRSLRFPHQNPVWTSHFPPYVHVTCPTHLILLDLITRIIFGAQQQYLLNDMGWDNIVSTATHYGLDGPGIESGGWGGRLYAPIQTSPGDHPASYNWYQIFLRGKAAWAWC